MNKVSFENYDPEKKNQYKKIRKLRECIDMLSILCNNSEFEYNNFFEDNELLKEIMFYIEKCFGVEILNRRRFYGTLR